MRLEPLKFCNFLLLRALLPWFSCSEHSNFRKMAAAKSANQWRRAFGGREEGLKSFICFALQCNIARKGERKLKIRKGNVVVFNAKKANLSAARKDRIRLPVHGDECRINEFFCHPVGVQSVLNTSALHSFQRLDSNTYRCSLPKLKLLSFEAAPVMDLRVTPTTEDCLVEMLSCKFQGSEILEQQNERFSALMMNRMTWNTEDSDPFLEVDVKLNLALEIYTQPFTVLPTSAIEGPGNLMMQALLDRLVPLLLEQLVQDYDKWANQIQENVP